MEIISSYSFLPLISAIFVVILGFFVWFKKPRQSLHIIFLFYSIAISVWLFGTFQLFSASVDADKIFWDRFIYLGVVFIPVFLYHFSLIYCEFFRHRWQKALLYFGYLSAFFYLPLSQTDYFVKDLYKYKWGVHTVAQTFHHAFLAYFAIYFILFFVNLIIYYRRAVGERKNQAKYLLFGFAILDIIGPLAFLPAYGVPIHPAIFLCALPFVLIVAYAIIRYNALEVKVIGAEVLVTLLNLVAAADIFLARNRAELILRLIIFSAILCFSLLIVRSIYKEIQRREEMTKLAKSLEIANARLQELDKQKTEFLSIAAHQLRTPLSIIKGYVELLSDGGYGRTTKEMKDIFHNMDESNEHLIKLVDEFLNISRIEQGRVKFDFQPGDAVQLVKGIITELAPKAKTKNLRLAVKAKTKIPLVNMDAEKVRHVIFNFVDNAIKYSEVGEVAVILENDKDGITVKVRDSGIGFGKIDGANFFQKFYRGDNVKGMNVTGTGLGLYVCRKFIEAHGGQCWARSTGLKKGSEFGFFLPFSR